MKYNMFNIKSAVSIIKRLLGENPKEVNIYTVLVSVSPSGMSRVIKAFIVVDNEPVSVGVGRVRGCGMDIGFDIAHSLFSYAYPEMDYREKLNHAWV